jgi:hypothetical protein
MAKTNSVLAMVSPSQKKRHKPLFFVSTLATGT